MNALMNGDNLLPLHQIAKDDAQGDVVKTNKFPFSGVGGGGDNIGQGFHYNPNQWSMDGVNKVLSGTGKRND